MKNISKILFGTATMLAVVSCSNDDLGFNRADSLEGRKTLTVNFAGIGDEGTTRAGFDSEWGKAWLESDQIRVYDDAIAKYARFDYNQANDVFVCKTSDEGVVTTEDKYMLFPADATSYGGYDVDTKMLYAVMKLEKELTYGQTGEKGNRAYVSNIPAFGSITSLAEDGKMEADAIYLTGIMRVKIENGAKVKSVTVKSMKVKEEGSDELILNDKKPLSGTFKVLLDGNVDLTNASANKSAFVIDLEDELLKPTYSSEITVKTVDEGGKALLTDYTSYIYIPIIPQTYDKLVVSYKDADDVEHVQRTGTNITVSKGSNVGGQQITTISLEQDAENVMCPEDLQKLIENAAAEGAAMTINVNKEQKAEIQVGDNTSADRFVKINLPKLEKDITLNIYGDFVALNTGITPALLITDASGVSTAGEGTLTINYIGNSTDAVPGNVTINTVSNVALKAESGKKYSAVTIEKVGDITLAGTFPSVATAEEYTISGDINVSGVFGGALQLFTQGGNITLGKIQSSATGHFKFYSYQDGKKEPIATTSTATIEGAIDLDNAHLIIKAGKIDVKANVKTSGNNFFSTVGETTLASACAVTGNWHHNNGDLTINGSSYGGTITVGSDAEYTELANVTLGARGTAATYADDGQISTLSLVKGASATIKGEVGTLTTAGIPVTIESGKVTTLTVTKPIVTAEAAEGGIVMTGGTIETLNGYALTNDIKTTTTVYSEGAADISAVSNDASLAFKAVWTNETATPADHLVNGKILTARQLMKLQTSLEPQYVPATVTLGADISFADDVEITWNPITWYENVTNQNVNTYTFDGNKKSLSGLNIKKDGNNVGFFSKFCGSKKVVVKNLILSDVSVDVTGGQNAQENKIYGNIGGLVGSITTETEIFGVNVSGTNVASSNSGKVYSVGGLIGSASAKTTIENTTVKFDNISGWYELGGLIGSIGNAEVTLKTSKVGTTDFAGKIVTLTDGFVLSYAAPATATNNGKIGMLVGTIKDAAGKFIATEGITAANVYTANKLTSANKAILGFNNNKFNAEGTWEDVVVYYVGQEGNYIGYSDNYTSGNAKVISTTGYTDAQVVGGLNVYSTTKNQ